MTDKRSSTGSAEVLIRRTWLEHVIKTLQGPLPSGHIGDCVFLLRDQLQDILDRPSDDAQARSEPPLAKLLEEVDPELAEVLTDHAAWVALIRNNVVTACANIAAGHSPSDYTADGMRNGIVAAIKGLAVTSTDRGTP